MPGWARKAARRCERDCLTPSAPGRVQAIAVPLSGDVARGHLEKCILAGVAKNERLVLGDQNDVRGARICFAPESAETADELLLNVARKRRQGEFVVG